MVESLTLFEESFGPWYRWIWISSNRSEDSSVLFLRCINSKAPRGYSTVSYSISSTASISLSYCEFSSVHFEKIFYSQSYLKYLDMVYCFHHLIYIICHLYLSQHRRHTNPLNSRNSLYAIVTPKWCNSSISCLCLMKLDIESWKPVLYFVKIGLQSLLNIEILLQSTFGQWNTGLHETLYKPT